MIHHDALEFSDGQVVLLTRLCEGLRATVLQLPIGAHPAAAGEAVAGGSLAVCLGSGQKRLANFS